MRYKETKTDPRQRILEVAERFFKKYGYRNTTFQMIADELGIANATISYHFKTKSHMLYEIFSKFFYLVSRYVSANLTEGFNYYLFYSIVCIQVYREIMKKESNWQLFYHKEQIEIWAKEKVHFFEERYRHISDDFHRGLSDEEIYMASIMDVGARLRMFQEFTYGEGNLTIDKYCYYHVYLMGKFSKLDENTIQSQIARAFEFANTHDMPTIYLLK